MHLGTEPAGNRRGRTLTAWCVMCKHMLFSLEELKLTTVHLVTLRLRCARIPETAASLLLTV